MNPVRRVLADAAGEIIYIYNYGIVTGQMTGRKRHMNGRINSVKDTKIVALMFGGLGDFYTDRRSLKQQGRRSGAALPGPMRD